MPSKSSWVLGAALALVASVSAEPENPRIYFPQRVKRDAPSDGATVEQVPDNTSDEMKKRDLFGDLFKDILGPVGHKLPDDFGLNNQDQDKNKDNGDVTTIVVQKTKYVGGTGGGPSIPEPTTSSRPKSKFSSKATRSNSGILVGPTGIIFPEQSTSDETTSESTSTRGGLFDPIGTLISDLLPDPSPTANTTSPTDDETTPVETTSSETTPEITDILPPIVTSLFPEPSTETETPSQNSTEIPTELPTGTPTETPIITTPIITTPIQTPTPTDADNSTVVETTPIETPTLPSTELPVTNITSEEPLTPTTTPTPIVIETTSSSETPIPTTTPVEVTPTPVPTSSEVVTPTEEPVTSIKPVTTDSNTDWLPTTMIVEPTSMIYTPPSSSATASSSQALPSNIPKVIVGSDQDQEAPAGTKTIQIGFYYALNYDFVVGNSVAAAQIFQYLPDALAFSADITADKVKVTKLVPFDTRDEYGYITTIAKLHYPETLIDALKVNLWTPSSKLYNNPSALVSNLTAVINPSIDLLGDNDDEGVNKPTGGPGSDDISGDGDQPKQSAKAKATTAGIAVAAVGLSAAYGAAMFIVARRYKRKRQNHRRASSISGSQGSSEMRYTGAGSPALMGGALLGQGRGAYGGVAGGRDSQNSGGSSARTAGISAPVATENSLGWN